MEIRIKLNGQPLPESYGDWVDLATAEDVYLQASEFQRVSLGVVMEIPEGYYAMVVPRSSTFERWGILQANGIGIIDCDYSGDNDVWGFPALAMRETIIPKGTRICQFALFPKHEPIAFIPVEHMGNPDRGGFGSTGR